MTTRLVNRVVFAALAVVAACASSSGRPLKELMEDLNKGGDVPAYKASSAPVLDAIFAPLVASGAEAVAKARTTIKKNDNLQIQVRIDKKAQEISKGKEPTAAQSKEAEKQVLAAASQQERADWAKQVELAQAEVATAKKVAVDWSNTAGALAADLAKQAAMFQARKSGLGALGMAGGAADKTAGGIAAIEFTEQIALAALNEVGPQVDFALGRADVANEVLDRQEQKFKQMSEGLKANRQADLKTK
jgi:hypothetical protein